MLQSSSTFTNAPITPRLVSRKYSNGLVLLAVFKKGYKKSGTLAAAEIDCRYCIVWHMRDMPSIDRNPCRMFAARHVGAFVRTYLSRKDFWSPDEMPHTEGGPKHCRLCLTH